MRGVGGQDEDAASGAEAVNLLGIDLDRRYTGSRLDLNNLRKNLDIFGAQRDDNFVREAELGIRVHLDYELVGDDGAARECHCNTLGCRAVDLRE